MNDPSQPEVSDDTVRPAWRPVGAIHRRILGVLAEKAKTTPDQYPLSLNALKNGCNQKSNRSPQMELTEDSLEEAMDQLREMGAVAEVLGGGRVARFRHYLYDWLGVDKTELAVMTELLLRGAQTVGELRGRAARMDDSIRDLAALRPVLTSLIDKGLVIAVTPEGRGQVVAHALLNPQELAKVRAVHAGAHTGPESPVSHSVSAPAASATAREPAARHEAGSVPLATSEPAEEIHQLRQDLASLAAEVARLKAEIDDIWSNLRS
jgi:uncharacterized protein YceH (UPF0502 family)